MGRTLALAAALLASGTAGAVTQFAKDGTASLTFGPAGWATLSGVWGAQWSLSGTPLTDGRPGGVLHYDSIGVEGTPIWCDISCTALQLSFTDDLEITSSIDASLRYVLGDLVLDIPGRTLSATLLQGPTGEPGQRFVVFSGATLTGSTEFFDWVGRPPVGLAFSVDGLKLGADFAQAVGAGLGLPSEVVDWSRTVSLGRLNVPAIPEPSTYALMGLGLLAAAGVARARPARRT